MDSHSRGRYEMRKRSVLDGLVAPWLVVVIASVAAQPPSVAASSRSSDRDVSGTSPTIDLGAALTRDGAFRGTGGLTGSVDMSAWTLVSDLARGDAPRFAPASVVPSASGFNNDVSAIAVVGTDLYVGGSFIDGAGIPEADFVARWNGTSWSALGSNGAGNGALNAVVHALAAYGTSLIVGGSFQNAAGVAAADRVARWNGSWSALGSLDGNGALNGYVDALGVVGGDVFVGGAFTNAAGIAEADMIAKWDGASWSAVGSNGFGNGALNDVVYGLAVSGSNV